MGFVYPQVSFTVEKKPYYEVESVLGCLVFLVVFGRDLFAQSIFRRPQVSNWIQTFGSYGINHHVGVFGLEWFNCGALLFFKGAGQGGAIEAMYRGFRYRIDSDHANDCVLRSWDQCCF